MIFETQSRNKERILTSSDLDQSVIEQDIKIFELENMIACLKKKLNHNEFKAQELANQLKTLIEEKQLLETKFNEVLQSKITIENMMKSENELIQQDLILERQKKMNIQDECEKMQEELNLLKEYTNEMVKEREKFDKNEEMIKNQKTFDIMSLERLFEKAKSENETVENERKRIQEELDILLQTYNYETHEMKFLKESNQILQNKVNFKEKKTKFIYLNLTQKR